MEIPSDVQRIIREYSSPIFRYPKEYRAAMDSLEIAEFPEIKKLLCTDKADQVIKALVDYANAYVEVKDVTKAEWDATPSAFPTMIEYYEESTRLNKLIRTKTRERNALQRKLMVVARGEDAVYWLGDDDYESSDEETEAETESVTDETGTDDEYDEIYGH